MKTRWIVPVMICVIFASVLFPFCDVAEFPNDSEPNTIHLTWNKSYASQTQQDVKRGLIWTLSWLGAELPKGSFDSACVWTDTTHVTINLDHVGFNENARAALDFICDSIRRSEEYKTQNGIDVGKFVMLTLGSSWHYYKITGVPLTIADFRTLHKVDDNSWLYGITNSGISNGNRRIRFSRDTSITHLGFVGEEGEGLLHDNTFHPVEYECFDIMPNGQLRFMIYDASGNLVSGAPLKIGKAGKPTKCLWCHETVVQPLFIDNGEVNGMLTNHEFKVMRDSIQDRLERYRLTLNTDMDWKQQKNHTLGELLYITYMEPTSLHLAHEWNTDTVSVQRRLARLIRKPFEEIKYVGFVYDRLQVDALDSISPPGIPESARETGREVNYFGK